MVSLEDIAEVLGANNSTKGEILRTRYIEGENFEKAYRRRKKSQQRRISRRRNIGPKGEPRDTI